MKIVFNLYEEIYAFYKNLIYKGIIRKGEYLPSVREVALARKINPNTVVKAYALLINDGLIMSINKKGYVVIYSNEDKKEQYIKDIINRLKLEGYSKEELIKTIMEEYKDD